MDIGVTLLVTHATHFLSQSSCVIVLHSGMMVFAGPYNELVSYVEMTPLSASASVVGGVEEKMNASSSTPLPTPSSRTAIKLSREELRAVLRTMITEQEESHDNSDEKKSSNDNGNGNDDEHKDGNGNSKTIIAMAAAGLKRATLAGADG
jgi:ABC-type multidrug transport system ATPase subunit